MTDQPTCEERIEGQLKSRLQEYRNGLRLQELANELEFDIEDGTEGVLERRRNLELDKDEARELYDLLELLDRGDFETPERFDCLSIDKEIVYKICLSWGGPADYFYVTVDKDGDVSGIEYQFQDWWDSARRRLSGNNLEVAEEYFRQAIYFEELD